MKLKKLLLIALSVVMILTTAIAVFVMNVSAESGSCTILNPQGDVITAADVATGDLVTTFDDLGEAVSYIQNNIQKDGYTVKITTANLPIVPTGVSVTYSFTIDGEYAAGQRATVSDGSTNSYWMNIKKNATIKNVILDSYRTFGFNGDSTATFTFENVKHTSKGGLLVNLNAGDNFTKTLNFNDCYFYKADGKGDPIIGMFGKSDVTINVNGSTFIQNGGSANDNWNRSIFNYRQTDASGEFVLNVGPSLKDATKNSVLYLNPTAPSTGDGISAMVTLSTGNSAYTTINLAKDTELYFGPHSGIDTTKTGFNAGTTKEIELNYVRRGTVIDNGAKWNFAPQLNSYKTYLPGGTYTAELGGVKYNYYQSSSTTAITLSDDNAPLRALTRVAGDAKYAAAIGSTQYYKVSEALSAASAGQTVTLLANVLEGIGNASPANGVIFDGANFAYYNLLPNSYIFSFTNKDLTIKNISIVSGRIAKCIMTDDTTNDATVGKHFFTLENVTSTTTKDVAINMSGDYYGNHVLNIINSNMTHTASGQPMLVTYPNNHDTIVDERVVDINVTGSTLTMTGNEPVIWAHAFGEFDANSTVNVNVTNSTLSQLAGRNNSLARASIIRADAVGCAVMNVNLNAGAKLVLNSQAAASGAHRAMISSEAAETNVVLDDNATLEFGSKTEKTFGTTTHMYFIYNEGSFGAYWNDYTDNGAEWIVNEYAPKVVMPGVAGYVAITSNEGAIARPSAIGTAGTYTNANLVKLGLTNGTGASIKLPANETEKASIRFVAEVDAAFKALFGDKAAYGSRVTKSSYLVGVENAFGKLESELYVDAPAEKWLDDATFGVALMNIPDYNTDYAVNSYVTITYDDGTTATFWAEFDDEANARSVAEVAQKALDSGLFDAYADGLNEILEAASGN